jgi:hypothetical protein
MRVRTRAAAQSPDDGTMRMAIGYVRARASIALPSKRSRSEKTEKSRLTRLAIFLERRLV